MRRREFTAGIVGVVAKALFGKRCYLRGLLLTPLGNGRTMKAYDGGARQWG
jgi:hypothetical protein